MKRRCELTTWQATETFPPGETLREEMAERAWTAAVLAEKLGCSCHAVSAIIAGTQPIATEMAAGLGAVLETGPEFWLNLQSAYDLFSLDEKDL